MGTAKNAVARPEARDGDSDGRPAVTRVVSTARRQFAEITGFEPHQVSALERNGEGWIARVEVVELERIPESTSVLGTYEVLLDRAGEVESYRRVRRYYRNQADDE